jgi:hypothetical protein
MATLTINDKQAREIYPTASPEIKAILENSFGGIQFFSQKITDRVQSFEDACEVLSVNPQSVTCDQDTPDEAAYKQLKVIVKALNEGWTPDWKDDDECKWYPWFYVHSPSGFRLHHAAYHYAYSFVGSRLCFKSRELAEYAASQFESIYKTFFTL